MPNDPQKSTEGNDAWREELQKRTQDCLIQLFKKASAKSGFDYICTLLRVDGVGPPVWDEFKEPETMLAQSREKALKADPSKTPEDVEKILGLAAYGQVMGHADLFRIIANMLRVLMGNPYSVSPLRDSKTVDEKVTRIRELAQAANHKCVADLFNEIYHEGLYLVSTKAEVSSEDEQILFPDGSKLPLGDVQKSVQEPLSFFGH